MDEIHLITGLGRNTDLILEIIDFFNGGDAYHYNPEAEKIRHSFAGRKLAGITLICSQQEDINKARKKLLATVRDEYPELHNHITTVDLPMPDIRTSTDDHEVQTRVYKAVRKLAGRRDLLISSGGRQQLTQRLIEAGLLYGCLGYFSITAPKDCEKRQYSKDFNVILTSARQFYQERRHRVIRDKLGDNFRSLYLLPTDLIDRLQKERIGVNTASYHNDLAWLRRLPKADLHCHLGGAYDDTLLKEMAGVLLTDMRISQEQQRSVINHIEEELGSRISSVRAADLHGLNNSDHRHALQKLAKLRTGMEEQHIFTATLVHNLSLEQIHDLSRDGIQEQDQWPRNLDWYMACGDLGGSALLQTESTLRLALHWLMQQAKEENVRFMEVRFSPDNYTRGGLTIRQVIDILLNEAEKFTTAYPDFHVHFLIMATRHKERAAMTAHVAAAVSFGQPGGGSGPRITGFDLAGQEKDNDPIEFAELFMPLHYHFMNVTIHAGEMAEADKIWQAIYALHARRIGHGLKLVNNRQMMNYIRDYGIAIEMCPSSNIQTNGFKRFDRPEDGEVYPLKKYMEHGITVTVNTDNRGISATTLSNEYLQAARLTENGLSKWQVLKLLKNGFKAAFLPRDEKDALLKKVDEEIFSLMLTDYYPE